MVDICLANLSHSPKKVIQTKHATKIIMDKRNKQRNAMQRQYTTYTYATNHWAASYDPDLDLHPSEVWATCHHDPDRDRNRDSHATDHHQL
mmetsp:Transcript_12968/g.19439  ORF Transcript_12968/g.19439 Transcript_12968/m.19439 type:complete len:91 (+) Transcript_12968:134-406(+)